jgi:hypothetical protein
MKTDQLKVILLLSCIFYAFSAFTQPEGEEDKGSNGSILLGGNHVGGNPEWEICDEPCNLTTRRYIEIALANNNSFPVQITKFEFKKGSYTATLPSGHQGGSLDLFRGTLIPIPQAWNSGILPLK